MNARTPTAEGAAQFNPGQEPDLRPGRYYVTAQHGTRMAWLLGPFDNDHAGALARVDAARREALRRDPRAHWWAFGTARLDHSFPTPPTGVLNRDLLPQGDLQCV